MELVLGLVGVAAVVAGLAVPRVAWASADTRSFSHTAEISGVSARGLYRLEAGVPLLRKSRTEDTLADVRIVGPNGDEVPYSVRSPSPERPPKHRASMLDPTTFPDGGVRATFDLGVLPIRHGVAELDIDGEEFLRQALVEVSDDDKEFAPIQEGRVVYRASHGARPAEELELVYPPSSSRYVRITLSPGTGDIVGFAGAEFSSSTPRAHDVQRFELAVVRTDRDPSEKTTTVTLDAAEPGVPIERIAFEPESGNNFQRLAEVLAANDTVHWAPVSSGFIYRLPTQSGTRIESIELAVERSKKRYFAFRVHDGDEGPLGCRSATAEYTPEEIVFRAASAGPHRLYVGSEKTPRPSYDFAPGGGDEPPKEASISALVENPDFETPLAQQTFSQKHGSYFAIAVGVIVMGVAAFTFRLLKAAPREKT
jgi:hypothetical protein